MVVLPDADVDLAADAAVSAAYGAAGERCMAISVAIAVGEVGDRFVDAIAARLPKLTIGSGADPDVDMGPLITAEHRERVTGYIAAGAESGAIVVVDGREAEMPSDGFFLGATFARPREHQNGRLHRRDLRPGAVHTPHAGRTTRHWQSSTLIRMRTVLRSSPATEAQHVPSSST